MMALKEDDLMEMNGTLGHWIAWSWNHWVNKTWNHWMMTWASQSGDDT
jgi:hypothetical protein